MKNRIAAYYESPTAAAAVADGPDSTARAQVVAAAGVAIQAGARLVVIEVGSIVGLSRAEAEQWARAGAVQILD